MTLSAKSILSLLKNTHAIQMPRITRILGAGIFSNLFLENRRSKSKYNP